jgi:hypothetical protein
MRPALHFAKKMFGNTAVEGVEVGVEEAVNALITLTEWDEILRFYLVEINPFCEKKIRERLETYEDKFRLILKPSVEAAKDFKDYSLNFVYIDGDHRYESVKEDLIAWYPKVMIGGMISGHDFITEDIHESEEVQRAVIEFFREKSIKLYLDEWDFWGIKTQEN